MFCKDVIEYQKIVIFLRDCHVLLNLTVVDNFNTVVLYQRYIKSLKGQTSEINNLFISMCCIIISNKITCRDPVRVRDVINVSYLLLTGKKMKLDSTYYKFKDSIIAIEQHVLRQLLYNVGPPQEVLPHSYLLNILHFMEIDRTSVIGQCSMNLINDSLLIPDVLQKYGFCELAFYCWVLSFEISEQNLPLPFDTCSKLIGVPLLRNINNNNNNNHSTTTSSATTTSTIFDEFKNEIKIILNYYNNGTGNKNQVAQQDNFEKLIKDLLNRGH
ncbi:hypothetical protein DLAC_05530 [Tieghemostelium lacteum]|uniref:Uncharacterized protein n=1 Tax=Tieghemostelium lacteum TaxID=361077 RepID=A0A151ZGE3_TIELA|nr:hypothetical protein DLAC_05530 [Tieghemostelium lacteum]|eukprot:KYQ92934.1 hypothetical protein DLAC_05530 [Tieghemostelium lacteum]